MKKLRQKKECLQLRTVADGENYSISATVGHTEGAIPKTNLNNDYAAGKIAQGSKSGSKGSITGHRKTFYGTTTDKSATTNSAVIRGLAGKSNGALVNGSTFDVSNNNDVFNYYCYSICYNYI